MPRSKSNDLTAYGVRLPDIVKAIRQVLFPNSAQAISIVTVHEGEEYSSDVPSQYGCRPFESYRSICSASD